MSEEEPNDRIYAKYQINGHEKVCFPLPPYEIILQVADSYNKDGKEEWIKVYLDGFDVTDGFFKSVIGKEVRPTTENLFQVIDIIKLNVEGGAA